MSEDPLARITYTPGADCTRFADLPEGARFRFVYGFPAREMSAAIYRKISARSFSDGVNVFRGQPSDSVTVAREG